MSTKALREALNELVEWRKDHEHDKGIVADAESELAAIEQAAKDQRNAVLSEVRERIGAAFVRLHDADDHYDGEAVRNVVRNVLENM